MTISNDKSLNALFGKEIVEVSKELNTSGRFTDQEADKIESVCKEILQRSDSKEAQRDFIRNLDLKTSCLLCAWMLRGGSPLVSSKHNKGK